MTIRIRGFRRFLFLLVCIYAGIAGLHTIIDFDLGWQMAQARAPFSSVDTLSYTAPGAPWIYPPLAGMLFRALFALGQYNAISWLCAFVLIFTVIVVALRSGAAVSLLLILAMPALAQQIIPRSGMFTVLLASVTVRLLLDFKAGRRTLPLWLLPLLMLAWVNLHPGFIAGLAILLGYLAGEILDLTRRAERPRTSARIRRVVPWIIATGVATLANPWGWRMYAAIAAQEHPTALESSVLREIAPLYREFDWRSLNPVDPLNAIWILLLVSSAVFVGLLLRRRWGLALFLGLGMVACLLSGRSQGVFIPIGCLVSGEAMAEARLLRPALTSSRRRVAASALGLTALLIVAVRSFNIVSNRAFVREDQITSFGPGASWWIPQEAATFIEQHHLPRELFASFNLGSYIAGRLTPHYRDFADGRYLPFRDGIVAEQLRLSELPLDSTEWSRAAARWNIRTVILPLARFYGVQTVPLPEDCASRFWTPVYLDTTAIVLVRNDAVSPARLASLRIDCRTAPLISATAKPRIGQYQQAANAAVILFLLGRAEEAQAMLMRAQSLYGGDDSLLLLDGELQASRGDLPDAQQSFRRALALHPSDGAWYQLGLVEAQQQDYPDAILAFRSALSIETQPSFMIETSLAQAQIFSGAGEDALHTLDRASQQLSSVPDADAAHAQLEDLRAAAFAQLSRWPQAITAEQQAIALAPGAARRWQALSTLYAAAGDTDHAIQARGRAESLAADQQGSIRK